MADVSALLAGLDLLGTFVFGLSGATLAVRRGLDVFGVLTLALAAALAGGMLRDMLLGAVPVAALTDKSYLAVAIAAGLTVFFAHPVVERLGKPVFVFDALGLGLFAVTGCRKALDHGLDPIPAILLGIMSAVGGGAVRDLLVAEVPRVLREEIYALAALVGAATVVVGTQLGIADWALTLAGVAAAFLLRVVGYILNWRAPRSPWS